MMAMHGHIADILSVESGTLEAVRPGLHRSVSLSRITNRDPVAVPFGEHLPSPTKNLMPRRLTEVPKMERTERLVSSPYSLVKLPIYQLCHQDYRQFRLAGDPGAGSRHVSPWSGNCAAALFELNHGYRYAPKCLVSVSQKTERFEITSPIS